MLHASDYFDMGIYRARVERARRAWADLLAGRRSSLVFLNLCAPFLCDLFGVEPLAYYTDLQVMADTQLRGIAWRLENLDEDEIPLAVFLDQATVHEAIAFDLPIECRAGSPPWGERLLSDIRQVETLGAPDPAHNQNLRRTFSRLTEMRSLVEGLPVMTSVHLHAPFTMAAQLLGAQELFLACYEQPDLVHRLLAFCVDYFQHFERVKWQFGISPEPVDEFVCWRAEYQGRTRIWVSDDTASMASPDIYRTFILPVNRALFERFEVVQLHMDGRWDKLIPLVAQLKPTACEVGGETDWAAAVAALGATTLLQGGVAGGVARSGTPEACRSAARAALETARGRARVVLTVANEVHPGTPAENLRAVVEVGRTWSADVGKGGMAL